jgi:RHS repeat-associated protein
VSYTPRDQRQAVTRKAVNLLDGTGLHDIVVAAYEYDDAGRLTKTTDVLGRVTQYTNDTLHRVTKETLLAFDDPAGARDVAVQRVRYDNVGNVLETWRGSDLLHELFTVDALNRVRTHVLDPGGAAAATTTSTYDAAGHELTRAASGNGLVTTAYDDLGLPAQEVVENGATDITTWYGHDDRGLLTSVTDGRGSAAGDAAYTTTLTYDQAGRRTVTKLPSVQTYTVAGGTDTVRPTTTVGYNTFGEAEHVRDPRGAVTTVTFDRLGRQVRVDHPSYTPPSGGPALAPYETWTYDGANRLTQHRNRGGGLTGYRYDGLDHLVGRDDPWVDGVRPTWSFTVDRAGRVLSATDPVGAVVEQTYDKLDRVRTRTEVLRQDSGPALRATTTYSYDDLGHLTKRVDPAAPVAATWLFEHDVTGNLRKVTDPLLEQTVTAYDAAGRWKSTTDPLGRKTEAVYDLAGRRTESNAYAPDGTRVSHATTSYDAVGNPTVQTSPRGYETWLAYDAANALRTVQQWLTAPSATGTFRTTGYDYDAGGLLTRSTDGRGFSTNPTAIGKITSDYDVTYTHNVWGLQESLVEPATTAHPAAADRTWTTSYDERGLPVTEVRPGGITVTRTFDALNRLTAENGASAPGVPAASRTFGYDLAGHLVTAGHPGGTLTFDYDDRGDLVASTHPHSATAVTRDLVGRPVAITDAAGTHAFTWTARGELDTETEPLTGVVIDRDYDDAGQLTLARFGTNAGVRRYTYDDLGRLKTDKIENSSGTVQTGTTYGYDADGNVTSQDVYAPGNTGAGLNTYTYDAIGRLTAWTNPGGVATGYAWDGADNRVTAGAATYVYDQRSRVVSSGSSTYTWSPRGTLVSRDLGTGTQAYTFDALDRMVAGGTDTFTYDSLDRIASPGFGYTGLSQEPTAAGTTTLSRGVDGSVVAMSQGTPSLVALNQHGDVAARFAASGTVSATRAYEPFGGVTGLVGSTGGFEFQADYQSGPAGLTWMGARWYDKASGAFASRDTMARHEGAATLLNRYGYGDANPVSFSDPDGHCAMRSTGWGGCSPDAGPNSYAVSYAVAGYTDSAVLAENERMHQLSLQAPPSPVSFEGIEDPDVIKLMLLHDVAGVALGGASAILGGFVDTFVNTVGRFQTVLGHIDEPVQLFKDLSNINAAAFNGMMRAAEEGLAFGSWLIHGATFGAVPKWDPSGALPRMSYAYDDARSREFSSLAEDVFTVVTPGGGALKGLSRLLKATRASKALTRGAAMLNRIDIGSARIHVDRFLHRARYGPHGDWSPEAGMVGIGRPGAAEDTTRVGRWMSQKEFDAMVRSGRVVEGAGGRTYVVRPPNPDAYPAGKGIYAEFNVPTSSLRPASKPEWAVIPGPNAGTTLYGALPPEMPPATCIKLVCSR